MLLLPLPVVRAAVTALAAGLVVLAPVVLAAALLRVPPAGGLLLSVRGLLSLADLALLAVALELLATVDAAAVAAALAVLAVVATLAAAVLARTIVAIRVLAHRLPVVAAAVAALRRAALPAAAAVVELAAALRVLSLARAARRHAAALRAGVLRAAAVRALVVLAVAAAAAAAEVAPARVAPLRVAAGVLPAPLVLVLALPGAARALRPVLRVAVAALAALSRRRLSPVAAALLAAAALATMVLRSLRHGSASLVLVLAGLVPAAERAVFVPSFAVAALLVVAIALALAVAGALPVAGLVVTAAEEAGLPAGAATMFVAIPLLLTAGPAAPLVAELPDAIGARVVRLVAAQVVAATAGLCAAAHPARALVGVPLRLARARVAVTRAVVFVLWHLDPSVDAEAGRATHCVRRPVWTQSEARSMPRREACADRRKQGSGAAAGTAGAAVSTRCGALPYHRRARRRRRSAPASRGSRRAAA
jgi:hypothetical protein